MSKRIIKILSVIVLVFMAYFFVNSAKALEIYNYKNKKYIMGIQPGSTVRDFMSERLGTYENLKELGIDANENFAPALIENIYKNFFKTSTSSTYKSPDVVIKTNDKYIDKNGNEYFLGLAGDVNFDGKVNTIDLNLMKRWILGLDVDLTDTLGVVLDCTDEESEEAKIFIRMADLNNDGNFFSNDLLELKRYLISEDLDKSEVSGDVNFDGVCDTYDYQVMLDIKNGKYELDESQEENSKYFDGMSVEQLEEYINTQSKLENMLDNRKPLTQSNN